MQRGQGGAGTQGKQEAREVPFVIGGDSRRVCAERDIGGLPATVMESDFTPALVEPCSLGSCQQESVTQPLGEERQPKVDVTRYLPAVAVSVGRDLHWSSHFY